jgi:fructuronate reductase
LKSMAEEHPPRAKVQDLERMLPYDRSRVTAGIVHLGVGAFQRAHLATYVDTILATDPTWGIIGASLRRPDTREALVNQNFLYTLVVRSAENTEMRVMGSLLDVLDFQRQPVQLMAAMTNPGIRIVSLTVTEKGYCHNPSTGHVDPQHPDILHDIQNPDAPRSAPGLIVRAIAVRKALGIAPFTVLSCDNLPANGETTARVVTGFAELVDRDLTRYIEDNVSFPSTMVDRIVPATTDADREMVFKRTGFQDAWPVVTEPFCQWVVEDQFSSGRPLFEKVGVEMVADVAPYELMKLRMLNGSHSTLAYLGYLSGYEYVSQAIADPFLREFVSRLMTEEAIPTLSMPKTSLLLYRDKLLERFANPALKHRTWQIAMDGSQKLPQRLLATIRDRLVHNQGIGYTALGVSAWMRYVMGVDESGQDIDVRDPLSVMLRQIADAAKGDPAAVVDGLLNVKSIFGEDLPHSPAFRAMLASHLQTLLSYGVKRTVEAFVKGFLQNS